MENGADVDVWGWYRDIAPVTRAYMTATFAITALSTLDIVSPFTLYYNSSLILQGQVWRLLTNFLYFGPLGINFFMHMYFAVQQCGWLERDFHGPGGTADFLFFLLLAATALLSAAPFVTITFFGSSLTLVIVYVWSKRHSDAAMGLFGVIPFRGAWLPYVMVGFSLMFGQDIQGDLLGIAVGHLYFYWADVWPKLAEKHGWAWKRLIVTPRMLYWIMGLLPAVEAREERMRVDDERRQQRLAAEAAAVTEGGTDLAASARHDDQSSASQLSGLVEAEEMELAAALAAIAELEARSSEPAVIEPAAQDTAYAADEHIREAEDATMMDESQTQADEEEEDGLTPAIPSTQEVPAVIESDVAPTMTAAEIRRRRAARFGMSDD